MPQYPNQNFNAMRQDAIRRSREMQRRARSAPPAYTPPDPEQGSYHPPVQDTPAPEPAPPPEHSSLQGLIPEELHSLLSDWDGEKLALAALLYLLYKEGADVSLLLALAYILL